MLKAILHPTQTLFLMPTNLPTLEMERKLIQNKCQSLNCVGLFATPWIVASQAPLSMKFSRQEYWSSHSLLQRIFPIQGSNPGLLHCRQILYHLSHQGSPSALYTWPKFSSVKSLLTYMLTIISLIHIMLILLLQNLLTYLIAKNKHPLLTYFSITGIKKVSPSCHHILVFKGSYLKI